MDQLISPVDIWCLLFLGTFGIILVLRILWHAGDIVRNVAKRVEANTFSQKAPSNE